MISCLLFLFVPKTLLLGPLVPDFIGRVIPVVTINELFCSMMITII